MSELKFFTYFKKYAVYFVITVIVVFLFTLLDMVNPLITKSFVDDVLIKKDTSILKYLLLALLVIGIVIAIFQYIAEYLCDSAGSKIASDLRVSLFKKIQSLSANFFDGINSGELMSRVREDVDRVWDIYTYLARCLFEVIVHTGIALVCMYSLNWKLAIFPTISIIIAAIIAVTMDKKLGVTYEEIAEESALLNNTVSENIFGVRTVKAFVRELFEIKKFKIHNKNYEKYNVNQSKVFVKYYPVIQCITAIVPCVVLIQGGVLVFKDELSIGELTAFVQYSTNIIWPMEMLGWITSGISRAKASRDRINKIIAQEPEIKDQKQIQEIASIKGDVEFANVSFTSKSGKQILQDINFKIQKGKTLGIMGSTGSGKTTIINLLQRMYDCTSGSILVDGLNIKNIPLVKLRKSIACVNQDVFLFSESIDSNVKLGQKEEYNKDLVEKALNDSCSNEFIETMKDGVDTVIGERGIGLSGGQKQRLTIARALSRDTPIVVFDDSTSALDTETEQSIQKTLAKMNGMTKIIITHRISAVKNADEIIVLQKGVVSEHGNHKSLMEQKGLYFETYNSQY